MESLAVFKNQWSHDHKSKSHDRNDDTPFCILPLVSGLLAHIVLKTTTVLLQISKVLFHLSLQS